MRLPATEFGIRFACLMGLGVVLCVSPLFLPSGMSLEVLATSLQVAGGASVIAVVLGTVLALLLSRMERGSRSLVIAAIVATAVVPLYVYVTAWQQVFGAASLMTAFGQPLLSKAGSVICIYGLAGVPIVVLIVLATLRWVDPACEAAAALDAGRFTVLFKITLPQVAPGIAVAAAWVFVVSSTDNTVADLYQVVTATELLYLGISLGDPASQALLQSIPVIGLLLVLICGTFWLAIQTAEWATKEPQSERDLQYVGDRTHASSWRLIWKSLGWLTGSALFAGLLFSLLLAAGRTTTETSVGWQTEWSLSRATEIVARVPWRYANEFTGTAVIASGVASLALIVGVGLALLLDQKRRHHVQRSNTLPLLLFAAVTLAIPLPLISMAVAKFFSAINVPPMPYLYDRTTVPAILAISLRLWPLCFFAATYAVLSVPLATMEAAALEGANHWRKIASILLPQRWHLLAAIWLVAALIAAGDVATSVLLIPPGSSTLATRIFGMLHSGVNDELGGLCAFLLLCLTLAGWGIWRLVANRVANDGY